MWQPFLVCLALVQIFHQLRNFCHLEQTIHRCPRFDEPSHLPLVCQEHLVFVDGATVTVRKRPPKNQLLLCSSLRGCWGELNSTSNLSQNDNKSGDPKLIKTWHELIRSMSMCSRMGRFGGAGLTRTWISSRGKPPFFAHNFNALAAPCLHAPVMKPSEMSLQADLEAGRCQNCWLLKSEAATSQRRFWCEPLDANNSQQTILSGVHFGSVILLFSNGFLYLAVLF